MSQAPTTAPHFVRAAKLDELSEGRGHAVNVNGHVIALFCTPRGVFAVDNRCPHMGFPLDRGTVRDCILTCHWHHARFELTSGGTFDPWADDVRSFPVEVRGNDVYVDVVEHGDSHAHRVERLALGLERNLPLVIAKSVIGLLGDAPDGREAFRAGLEFGVRYRRDGWGVGLTTLTCLMNLLPVLNVDDRPRALYHGLSSVANDTDGSAPRFMLEPLRGSGADLAALKRWLREFVEVRDPDGAERCIVTAVHAGARAPELAEMLFAATTDHRYLSIGHVADFTNKAFEALEHAGWDLAEPVLASLARSYATGDRMEESNSWRNPVDLIAILERAFDGLPAALEKNKRGRGSWSGGDQLVEVILGDDPAAIADAMLAALGDGCTAEALAGAVAYAAALRIAHFATSNEFGDWDTAHHSFTFSNAMHQAVRRAPTAETLRGVFDAAMSVYLDRFLNVPPARLPNGNGRRERPAEMLDELMALLDRQQQVNQAGALVGSYLHSGADGLAMLAALGHALLREDRDFHTIQDVEAAIRQYSQLIGTEAGAHLLIATARYLAAHSPTVRSQGQTYQIALRLHRGERVFDEQ
jgi:nitrite reductase/ring-hydroxylating ferredoxin subunit